jgi:arylformamidase
MIIDLTMPIEEGMTTFPSANHPRVEISQLARHGIEGRETRKLVLGTHTGTHIDAPRHFIRGGGTVDDIPLEQMNGPAVLINLPVWARSQPMEVTPSMINNGLGERNAERVLIRYDWDDYLGSVAYYDGHPFLNHEAAQTLIDRGCKLLGFDSPSPDYPGVTLMPIHGRLLGQGVVLLEYLVNLKTLAENSPSGRFELTVAPIKIKGGDGAPVRCFARV